MRFLELKVPPPLVALLVGVAMWGLARFPHHWEMDLVARYLLSAVFVAIGLIFAASGFIGFRKAKTTIDPMHPGKTSSLVTSGIYRYTRNPMYVGLWFLLLAWAFFLQSPWAFLGTLLFVVWVNYLQIIPEERILSKMFGEAYTQYQSRVRRWL
ncbi:MAG TPA: isoprenylcysteine carboxylmethyltransferase family protein [Gemmatales bacterium]|nr:isoprenylcysteine carboxylmethyltransferase family protein [Gemmatales bacterium]